MRSMVEGYLSTSAVPVEKFTIVESYPSTIGPSGPTVPLPPPGEA